MLNSLIVKYQKYKNFVFKIKHHNTQEHRLKRAAAEERRQATSKKFFFSDINIV